MSEELDDAAALEAMIRTRATEYRLEPAAAAVAEAAALWDRSRQRMVPPDLEPARAAAARAAERGRFTVPHVEASSRLPGGAAIHEAIGRSVERHLNDLVTQLDTYAAAVNETLTAVLAVLSAGVPHEHPDLVGQLETLQSRLDEFRRATP